MLGAARRVAAFASLAAALGACSSEAIDRGGASGGNAGTAGASGSSGRGGSGGSSGAPSVAIPDYTQSPCYGEPATTDVYDLATHEVHAISATCRAEGDRVRFYVADDLWETKADSDAPVLGQGEVDAFMARYELVGSSKAVERTLGILPTDELVYGALTESALTDGKLPIFVIDSSGAGDGYLCGWCDRPALHLDGPLLRSLHTDTTLSIAAHETYHAIHRGYDADEEVWVDETLAQSAMIVNGFYTDQSWVDEFMHNTNQAWGPGVDDPHAFDYGAGLLFGTYLFEHGGVELLNAITHEPLNGWAGVDRALETIGYPATGFELWKDMAIAAFVNDVAAGYGFKSIELDSPVLPYDVGTGTTLTETLEPYGLMFVTFDSDAASVELDTTGNVSARLVLDGTPLEVREMAANELVSFDGKAPRVLVLTAPASAKLSVTAR